MIKILGTDISTRYINFEMEGEEYSIHFRNSFTKGICAVSVWKGKRLLKLQKIKIRSTYPSLFKLSKEIILLILLGLKQFTQRKA